MASVLMSVALAYFTTILRISNAVDTESSLSNHRVFPREKGDVKEFAWNLHSQISEKPQREETFYWMNVWITNGPCDCGYFSSGQSSKVASSTCRVRTEGLNLKTLHKSHSVRKDGLLRAFSMSPMKFLS